MVQTLVSHVHWPMVEGVRRGTTLGTRGTESARSLDGEGGGWTGRNGSVARRAGPHPTLRLGGVGGVGSFRHFR